MEKQPYSNKQSKTALYIITAILIILAFLGGFYLKVVVLPINQFLDLNYRLVIAIMIIFTAGLIGGLAKNAYEEQEILYPRNIVLGIFSALLTPIFLKLISSNYLSQFLKDQNDFENSMILFSLLLITSFFAETFIYTVKDKMGALAEEAKRASTKAEAAIQVTHETKQEVHELSENYIKIQLAKLNEDQLVMLKDILDKFNSSTVGLEDIYNLFNEMDGKIKYESINELIKYNLLNYVKTLKNEKYYQVSNVKEIKLMLELELKKYG